MKVGLLKDYVYNKKEVGLKNLKDVITNHPMFLHNLMSNFDSKDKPSKVVLTIVLTQNDLDNLKFVCKFYDKINFIIKKYSRLNIKFFAVDFDKILKYKNLKLSFNVDLEKWIVRLSKRWFSAEQKCILKYIENHELIQICMNIYNDFEKKDEDRGRYPLKNTFAILGSYRSFGNLEHGRASPMMISPKKWSMYISGQNTKTYYSISIGYYLCIMKLWDLMHKVQKSCVTFGHKNFASLYEDIFKQELKKSHFFNNLRSMILKYIGMTIDVKYIDEKFMFILKWKYWHQYKFNELSSGDQSFLIIILTVFGYDLDSWFMIIDEPELHLHPQLQTHFMEFIDEVSKKYNLQVIFATHSPSMINEHNISNVYRFSKPKLQTYIEYPFFGVGADDSELIQMLKFENIAKIFFVNKIIMVEWETDAYFLKFYLDYLKTLDLSKFGIKSYYIWDRDNIVDMHIISQQDMHLYNQKNKQYYRFLKKHSYTIHKRHYGLLVEMLQKWYTNEYIYIKEQIENLYSRDIFILKKGDLEAYIGINSKWLEETIHFCQYDFKSWLKYKKFAERRNELFNIFEMIFK